MIQKSLFYLILSLSTISMLRGMEQPAPLLQVEESTNSIPEQSRSDLLLKGTYLKLLPRDLVQELKRFLHYQEPETECFWSIEKQLADHKCILRKSLGKADYAYIHGNAKYIILEDKNLIQILDVKTGLFLPFASQLRGYTVIDNLNKKILNWHSQSNQATIWDIQKGTLLHTIKKIDDSCFEGSDFVIFLSGSDCMLSTYKPLRYEKDFYFPIWTMQETYPKFLIKVAPIDAARQIPYIVDSNDTILLTQEYLFGEGKYKIHKYALPTGKLLSSATVSGRFRETKLEGDKVICFESVEDPNIVWKEDCGIIERRPTPKPLQYYIRALPNFHDVSLYSQVLLSRSYPGPYFSYVLLSDYAKTLTLSQILVLRDFYHHLLQVRPWKFTEKRDENKEKIQEVYPISDEKIKEIDPALYALIKETFKRYNLEVMSNSEFEKIAFEEK